VREIERRFAEAREAQRFFEASLNLRVTASLWRSMLAFRIIVVANVIGERGA
jgi:hypothetical protein